MRNWKVRLKRLEQATNARARWRCFCVTRDDEDKRPEVVGYSVTSVTAEGRHEEVFHCSTRAELEAFAARPDVDLTIIEIVHTAGMPAAPQA